MPNVILAVCRGGPWTGKALSISVEGHVVDYLPGGTYRLVSSYGGAHYRWHECADPDEPTAEQRGWRHG